MLKQLLACLAVAAFFLSSPRAAAADPLAHTFSIVARDPATGDMGVAVQSHWFSVGSLVTWAEAGVGAIATQSFVDPSFAKEPVWAALIARLPAAGLLPNDAALVARIQALAPKRR